MRWSDLVGVAMATLLLLVTPQVASAQTAKEVECCKFMKKVADKYLLKHGKLVNKCTGKMNKGVVDGNPKYATAAEAIAGEKCDDGYDRVLGINNDFAIDKFHQKSLNKMVKKCKKFLDIPSNRFGGPFQRWAIAAAARRVRDNGLAVAEHELGAHLGHFDELIVPRPLVVTRRGGTKAAARTLRRIVGAVADVADLHIAIERTELDPHPRRAAILACPLAIRDETALVDNHRVMDLVHFYAVDQRHSGIAHR